MLSLEEAFAVYSARVTVLPSETVPTADSLYRTLREDSASTVDLPPFTQSAMDGYAVRGSEVEAGTSLPVAMTLAAAGVDEVPTLAPGSCARIFTGGPVPNGADTVIMQEDVTREGDRITIVEGVVEGENIRRRGGDVCLR